MTEVFCDGAIGRVGEKRKCEERKIVKNKKTWIADRSPQ